MGADDEIRYKKRSVVGVVFLYNIMDLGGLNPPPVSALRRLCRDDFRDRLIFVTTHWDCVSMARGEAAEQALRRRLGSMLSPRIDRFDMTTSTAWRILSPLLE